MTSQVNSQMLRDIQSHGLDRLLQWAADFAERLNDVGAEDATYQVTITLMGLAAAALAVSGMPVRTAGELFEDLVRRARKDEELMESARARQ